MRNRDYYDKHRWRLKHGYGETQLKEIYLTQLADTEWSHEFEQLMRNRLIIGAMRYGVMGHGGIPRGKPKYDRCESIRKRLKFYEDTGNADWLVDIANMSLLMFEERYHPNFHLHTAEDGIYHDNIIKK